MAILEKPPTVPAKAEQPTFKSVLKQLDPLRLLRRYMHGTRYATAFKNLGHYPDYIYWSLRGKPARTPHLVKQLAVLDHAKRFNVPIMIEAGTYYGEMVDAMKGHFDAIYSIELDDALAERCTKLFAPHKHVHILHGDSQQLIPELLDKIDRPALFWLDAGYYGWSKVHGNKDRLIVELESILGHRIKEHVIVMDDAHGLNGQNGAPTVKQLCDRLLAQFPDRQIVLEHNILRITPQTGTGCSGCC